MGGRREVRCLSTNMRAYLRLVKGSDRPSVTFSNQLLALGEGRIPTVVQGPLRGCATWCPPWRSSRA
eukprot:138133-Hanusia_phi.AAC.1